MDVHISQKLSSDLTLNITIIEYTGNPFSQWKTLNFVQKEINLVKFKLTYNLNLEEKWCLRNNKIFYIIYTLIIRQINFNYICFATRMARKYLW